MSTQLDKSVNQSTQVAFLIIEIMANKGQSMRLTDIARSLDMPKARVYRFLQTLVQLGYVDQDKADERYRLTLKLFHLGQAIADKTQLTSVARPFMVRLRDSLRQTTTLSIPEPGGMRVVDIVRVETPVQIVTQPGTVLGFDASAQGKVALAFGSPKLFEGQDANPATLAGCPKTERDAGLGQLIETVRANKWAVAPEEVLPGINALSAPIFDAMNRFVATITIAGLIQEIPPQPSRKQIEAVCGAARAISERLGCTEYPQ